MDSDVIRKGITNDNDVAFLRTVWIFLHSVFNKKGGEIISATLAQKVSSPARQGSTVKTQNTTTTALKKQ